MRKFLNDPKKFVEDMLEGILYAHADHLVSIRDDNRAIINMEAPIANKVGIAGGGGSGHLPLILGYVGKGLLDGVAIGNVFSSPNAQAILDVSRAINSGKGVLHIYGNYGGDMMNLEMANDMSVIEGLAMDYVVVNDDILSAPLSKRENRRGIAGIFFVYKIASSKADEFASLTEVKRVALKANDNVRTMGVALTPGTIPSVGSPNYEINQDEMEIGVGIHSEPGILRGKIESTKEIVSDIIGNISKELNLKNGSRVSVLVNGLGGTSLEELYIFYRDIYRAFEKIGVTIHKKFIGNYATSLDMKGVSISILLLDEELTALLDTPYYTPFLPLP